MPCRARVAIQFDRDDSVHPHGTVWIVMTPCPRGCDCHCLAACGRLAIVQNRRRRPSSAKRPCTILLPDFFRRVLHLNRGGLCGSRSWSTAWPPATVGIDGEVPAGGQAVAMEFDIDDSVHQDGTVWIMMTSCPRGCDCHCLATSGRLAIVQNGRWRPSSAKRPCTILLPDFFRRVLHLNRGGSCGSPSCSTAWPPATVGIDGDVPAGGQAVAMEFDIDDSLHRDGTAWIVMIPCTKTGLLEVVSVRSWQWNSILTIPCTHTGLFGS